MALRPHRRRRLAILGKREHVPRSTRVVGCKGVVPTLDAVIELDPRANVAVAQPHNRAEHRPRHGAAVFRVVHDYALPEREALHDAPNAPRRRSDSAHTLAQ